MVFRRFFYECCRLFVYWLFLVAARVRVVYAGRVPKRGGFILASNHISHFEPPVISAFFFRRVDWMAMDELFRNNVAASVLNWVGAFRVNRDGTDRTAIRTAIRRLEQGHIVGICPEGGIRAGPESVLEGAPMRPGVGALAVMAGRPVVPCVVLGTDRLYHVKNWFPLRRVPVWMAFGEPIQPPESMAREAAREYVTRELSEAFVRLKDVLCERFSLRYEDLPHSPQARKGEDPMPILGGMRRRSGAAAAVPREGDLS